MRQQVTKPQPRRSPKGFTSGFEKKTALTPEEEREKLRERMMQVPAIKKFYDDGANKRVSLALSLMYMCYTLGDEYFEEVMDVMNEYDLVHKKIKTVSIRLRESFDAFDKVFSVFVRDNKKFKEFTTDYETLKRAIDAFGRMDSVREYEINQNNEEDKK